MRRHDLENLVVTGKVEGRRASGRQRLSSWIPYAIELEGAQESAYLRQVHFYRRPFSKKLTYHVWTVRGKMHVIFEVRSFKRFVATSILRSKI